jgi:inhibitor of KinA sporulation pathway (predicted exonuclease)
MDYSTLLFVDCKATIWEKEPPSGQTSELIGIDLAVVDTVKNQVIEHESVLIKTRKSKISNYCEKVFGINQSALDTNGITFHEAYRKIRIHYMSRDRVWASWGAFDKWAIEKQCKISDLESLFQHPHSNMQHMFCIMTGVVTDPSLDEALKYCDLSSTENRAYDCAQLFIRMAKGLRGPVKTRIVVPSPGQFKQMN